MARTRTQAQPSPGLSKAAPNAAGDSGTAEVVAALRHVLGRDLTAVVAGVAPADAVDRLTGGERPPSAEVAGRLRSAHEVVQLLLEVESPAVVRAWFNGMNPMLGDRSPAAAIADDPALVLRAARAFRAYG